LLIISSQFSWSSIKSGFHQIFRVKLVLKVKLSNSDTDLSFIATAL